MIVDKGRIYDGWTGLEAGVDAGRAPDTIDVNQCVSAENATFRGGKFKTRPGIRILTENFPDITMRKFCYGTPRVLTSGSLIVHVLYVITTFVSGDDFTNVGAASNASGISFIATGTTPTHWTHGSTLTEGRIVGEYAPAGEVPNITPLPQCFVNQDSGTIYKNGNFQAAAYFSPHGTPECLIAMIGGRMFKIIPGVTSSSVTEVVPTTDVPPNFRNRQDLSIAYLKQADKWFVIQDGFSRAILYDGFTCRRTVTTNDPLSTEIPVGTITDYGMGRIETVVNQRDIAFGDLFGSHPGPDPGDSIILFTERNFLTEGFDAAIPFEQGVATGSSFFPQLDTSTGTGQFLVFSSRGASSFFLSIDRTLWKTSQFQIAALLSTGFRGHRSVSIVNEDLWFRADDGVRSYRQARSEPSGWAHIPLSTNVKQFTDFDTPWLLQYISSMYFDNRVIMTCSPMWNQGRVVHSGLLVMDFDIISSFGQRFKPAWDGHWTMPPGITISQVVTGVFNNVTRAFIFGVDTDGMNQLYELSLDDKIDFNVQPIAWELVMRAFDYMKLSQQSSSFSESELYDADIWVSQIGSNATMTSFYRPDGYPDWIAWKDFTQEFNMIGTPGAIDPGGNPTIRSGFAPRQSFGKPGDDTDPTTKRRLRRGYLHQVKLNGTGHVVLDRFRIHAQKLVEKSRATVTTTP